MTEKNFSLETINALSAIDPSFEGLIERKISASPEIFLKHLYKDIDEAIVNLEQQRHMYQGKMWGEDQLTFQIITFLKGRLYDAEHDTQHGGHVDILVKQQHGRFEWIGEAKLWDGPSYIQDGWIQLTERYSTGTINDNAGGLIIYIKQQKALDKFQNWRSHFESNNECISLAFDQENPLRFESKTAHPTSGLPYSVRHMAVCLYHHTGDN
ncbi:MULTISPECIES: hypothetical protein [Yersinia]|uniref:hypothetical protein n=1 Tax=Yersinia TaxID=629 RepID=UPI0025AB03CA|nr:hypothetical protein [Yersinia mollaretii]EKN5029784.1 hypothetical protein [Yersinia enterocolitica]MDN0109609.1 hypothetical protein [Yersinia mollaretii]HDL7594796.1 hypothetical protein [Yersinia enterocolitica]HEN3477576.1 hypothetical protein [Yersinia enterocolitica]HEN3478328.1 hypothetical protein [Yersinia enterocolitica]